MAAYNGRFAFQTTPISVGSGNEPCDLIALAELLEELDEQIHEYLRALTAERRGMLEAEILATSDQLRKIAMSFRN